MSEQKCLICSRETATGLRINTSVLCWDCEAELLQTEVTDPKYDLFVKKLKQVWPPRPSLQHLAIK
ncbi:MAG TPA: sigma factor G inhibitor Gin [Oscillospiraceae bacterium]|nr:sigma factor G inhibitor Gin [Oscillospiraceae bacterium]